MNGEQHHKDNITSEELARLTQYLKKIKSPTPHKKNKIHFNKQLDLDNFSQLITESSKVLSIFESEHIGIKHEKTLYKALSQLDKLSLLIRHE